MAMVPSNLLTKGQNMLTKDNVSHYDVFKTEINELTEAARAFVTEPSQSNGDAVLSAMDNYHNAFVFRAARLWQDDDSVAPF